MVALGRLRERVRECMSQYLYASAAFVADKVVTMSGGNPCDVIALAQAHYCAGSYRRALHLVRKQLEGTGSWPKSDVVLLGAPKKSGAAEGSKLPLSSPAAAAASARENLMGISPEKTSTARERDFAGAYGCDLPSADDKASLSPWHLDCLRYLAARCLEKLSEWEICLVVLGNAPVASETAYPSAPASQCSCSMQWPGKTNLHAALCFLRGRAFAALGNRPQSIFWYSAALRSDPYCYEAFEQMVDNHMLSTQQEVDLVAALKLSPGEEWLRNMYACKIKMYGREAVVSEALRKLETRPMQLEREGEVEEEEAEMTPGTSQLEKSWDGGRSQAKPREGSTGSRDGGRRDRGEWGASAEGSGTGTDARAGELPAAQAQVGDMQDVDMELNVRTRGGQGLSACTASLARNADVATCRAELEYHTGNYRASYATSKRVLEEDPYHMTCMPTHVAAALELGHKNDLFLQGHRLAQEYPKSALAWFTVACYYMCTRQYDQARRFFSKATAVGPTFAPAWLGFGHAYAAQDETDQAMVAYRTAARTFSGCHLPLLCIGIEYHRSNNMPLAHHFLEEARVLCPGDPLAHNELGVVAYHNGEYAEAEAHFNASLQLVGKAVGPTWEALLVNLGHVYRKQRRFASALAMYERALSICPLTASTFTAIGYTWHLQGDTSQAIEWYHKGLDLRPDDFMASEMLGLAVAEESNKHGMLW